MYLRQRKKQELEEGKKEEEKTWIILDALSSVSELLPHLILTTGEEELILPLDRCVNWGYEESFLWRGGD